MPRQPQREIRPRCARSRRPSPTWSLRNAEGVAMTNKRGAFAGVAVFSSLLAVSAAAQPAPAPQLLVSLTLQNDTRLPLAQPSITTANVDVQLYGDGRNIIVATGRGPHL